MRVRLCVCAREPVQCECVYVCYVCLCSRACVRLRALERVLINRISAQQGQLQADDATENLCVCVCVCVCVRARARGDDYVCKCVARACHSLSIYPRLIT